MSLTNNDSLRLKILHYFRCGQLSFIDRAFSRIAPRYVYMKNAGTISGYFRKLDTPVSGTLEKNIVVKNYHGTNVVANKIAEYLASHAGDELYGAYAHGSVGNSEEVHYSDFDGLLILKNKSLENAQSIRKFVRVLKESGKMMLEMDPLQHHGWFILFEYELRDYPEFYFPHELFQHAGCLFGSNNISIRIRDTGYADEFSISFNHLSDSILRKLQSKNFLENYYVFKNLLSEFMLLPAVYIQAKTGQGVFKKFSFAMMEKDLGRKCGIMDEISAIRNAWNYQAPEAFIKKIMEGSPYASHHQYKMLSGEIPSGLKNKFSDDMLGRMKDFVTELKSRLH